MQWTDASGDELPEIHKNVLIWVKYEDGDEDFVKSWRLDPENMQRFNYKCSHSDAYWAMGSARNYTVLHYMDVDEPG